MVASRAGMWNTKIAHSTAVAAPAIAQICARTRNPASKPRRTTIGSAATRVESHQCPSGSYTCVQVTRHAPESQNGSLYHTTRPIAPTKSITPGKFPGRSRIPVDVHGRFGKHPGWGYADTSTPGFAFPVICTTWRLYSLCPHSIARTSRHHGGVPFTLSVLGEVARTRLPASTPLPTRFPELRGATF